jgi:hypothetical protein
LGSVGVFTSTWYIGWILRPPARTVALPDSLSSVGSSFILATTALPPGPRLSHVAYRRFYNGGRRDHNEGLVFKVSKLQLISRVQALIHGGSLKIHKDLAEAAALVEELQGQIADTGASAHAQASTTT